MLAKCMNFNPLPVVLDQSQSGIDRVKRLNFHLEVGAFNPILTKFEMKIN